MDLVDDAVMDEICPSPPCNFSKLYFRKVFSFPHPPQLTFPSHLEGMVGKQQKSQLL